MNLNITLVCKTREQIDNEMYWFMIANIEDIDLWNTPIRQGMPFAQRLCFKDGTFMFGVCRTNIEKLYGTKVDQAIISSGAYEELIDLVSERMTDDVPDEFKIQYINKR